MRFAVSVVAVAALAGEARAGSIASVREDVDGDGVAEEIELDDAGVVHIGGKAKADVAIARGAAPRPTKATLGVAKHGGTVWIVVDATTGARREAIVLEGRAWREVARFPLGGVGLDREYSVEVDAGPHGVVRYQKQGRVERCDGVPSYLFAERYEGGAWKRLQPIPPRVPSSAVAQARLDGEAAAVPMLYQARGASHRPGATDAEGLAIPSELDDGRLETVWREDLPGAGEGQFFTFHPRVPSARAQQLRIVPGNPASAAAQKAAGRPRSLFVVSAQTAVRVELPDAANDPLGAAYVVDFAQPLGGCVSVILESAWGKGPTSIAELQVFAEGERSGGGEALLAKLVAEGQDGAV
ncbi:MAG: hypothetical protein KIT77_23465, partial [Caldilinea sp.]|nr:hypothetical protein [Caldilinea sp.]